MKYYLKNTGIALLLLFSTACKQTQVVTKPTRTSLPMPNQQEPSEENKTPAFYQVINFNNL
jgi:hypothetical protein